MIQLSHLSLELGTHLIFDDVTCVIQKGDRVGVIGRNGAGKSTLLKVIAGKIQPTSGHLHTQKNTRIAYLPQEEILESSLSVFQEALSAFVVLFHTEQEIQHIEKMIIAQTCTQELLERYGELQSILQTLDRHEMVARAHETLEGLGFTAAMLTKNVHELSTGWKMRLALVKLLLTEADVLLFDEPTNHLDIVTQQWFLQKLQSMKQGFLLVSHDRAYLEKACTCILELERGHGTYYRGNLQKYLEEKERQHELARTTRARQEREITQKQATAERFRAGTRSRQARSLIKQIERTELVEIESPLPTISFRFPPTQRSGSIILTFQNVSYEFNGMPIFTHVSGEIKRGERIAIVAANGVGKSTLINCITGRYTPLTGTVTYGHNVITAYFQQEQARILDPIKTVFDEVMSAAADAQERDIRQLLGSFQFSGDDVKKKIGVLSGGEKNRVAMVKILLQKANFLILDEPTNHLDLYAKDVLRQALVAYQGTILFVSHDLDFVSKLATRIIELTPQGAFSYPGTYEEFCVAKEQAAAPILNNRVEKMDEKKSAMTAAEKARKKEETALIRAIDNLERDKEKYYERLAGFQYGTQEYEKMLTKVREIEKKVKHLEEEWQELLKAM
ncbi:MAG TPA: ABC-F family ATP-binding cassette domain-containing protein [Candidatus Bathyarchaeia archaeon]|nr:ABC-F family ATP-binding cassette domain-containing protein [Candidatus Bathyarchaeia archaeon]